MYGCETELNLNGCIYAEILSGDLHHVARIGAIVGHSGRKFKDIARLAIKGFTDRFQGAESDGPGFSGFED